MNTTHWSQQTERASALGVAFLIGVMKFTGPKFIKILAVPIAFYYYLTAPDVRKFSRDYLRRASRTNNRRANNQVNPTYALNRPLSWLVFQHILSFSQSLVDRVWAWSAAPQTLNYRINDRALLKKVMNDTNQGAVFLVSHLGNFDLAMVGSKISPKKRFTIILDIKHAALFGKLRHRFFASEQARFIEPKNITPIETISLIKRVEEGEILVIAADRTGNEDARNSVPVNFLGDVAMFPTGAYVLAHLLEAPTYTLFSMNQRNSCLVLFQLFEQNITLPRHERQFAINRYAQKYAAILEEKCLNYPLHWYNFYDFWAKKKIEQT